MIIDITKIELNPGNLGRDCLGNGLHKDIECCCEECDYLMCCVKTHSPEECTFCLDTKCPRKKFA